MTSQFWLYALPSESASRAFLASRNDGKRFEKSVKGKPKMMYPCPLGFADVEIALQANRRGLRIEIYEDDGEEVTRYDSLVRGVRRKREAPEYIVRKNSRTR